MIYDCSNPMSEAFEQGMEDMSKEMKSLNPVPLAAAAVYASATLADSQVSLPTFKAKPSIPFEVARVISKNREINQTYSGRINMLLYLVTSH